MPQSPSLPRAALACCLRVYGGKGAAIGSADANHQAQRIEIYVDTQTPTGTAACSDRQVLGAVAAAPSKYDVVAALCDGARVVVVTHAQTHRSIGTLLD